MELHSLRAGFNPNCSYKFLKLKEHRGCSNWVNMSVKPRTARGEKAHACKQSEGTNDVGKKVCAAQYYEGLSNLR